MTEKEDEIKNHYKALEISSPAFQHGESIPQKYTCQGIDINPAIYIDEIPNEAKSLVLIVDDPDAPHKTWLHWLVWNIPVDGLIEENEIPGTQGINDFQKVSYGGPCPPTGRHRYFFKVYALDQLLDLNEGTGLKEVHNAMHGHILAFGELIGVYTMS